MGFRSRKIGNTKLFAGVNNEKHAFTVVVGDNGSGKTELLLDIFRKYYSKYAELYKPKTQTGKDRLRWAINNKNEYEILTDILGVELPRKLICASTSQFERFQNDFRADEYPWLSEVYSYIGSKPYIQDLSPSVRIASNAIKQLLIQQTFDLRKVNALKGFLDEFGFSSVLKIKLTSTITEQDLLIISSGDIKNQKISLEAQLKLQTAAYHFEETDLLNLLSKLEAIYTSPEVLLSLSNQSLKLIPSSSQHDIEFDKRELSDLLRSGLAVVADIETLKDQPLRASYLSPNAKVRSLSARSSGEQCLFLLFLGIVASIEDNSLVLIDEPEISLHPSWQERFVDILNQSLNTYSGCHFIIATHSPLIVSNISTTNCEILNIQQNSLLDASEHYLRSSDYQLVNVFESPGHSNEYLLKISMHIYSKVKTYKFFDELDIKQLEMLNRMKQKISNDDPILELIDSLNEVFKVYGY
ncbi:MAG TPA: ATP-binding protein [Pseudoalteromonas sp.]|jgi:predicted ATPase|uniref:ATP-binding protein n=2 Tax=root TaxID=1 RepID=A0A7X9YG81_9GAMM|nr:MULTISPECIES: AAA family ATPase [Pseudoalteromonas]NMF49125.1 ATP-binding protein [Pseudoalteromonas arctica]HDY92275.1 ATP-binding protein [Pseudoalteromonas sp.]HDZ33362.1 ATP-binding protein [Pseudoalteromonas sp.]